MEAGRGDNGPKGPPTPRDEPMVRINRRAQAQEIEQLLTLREGNTGLSSVVAREIASLQLGRLATASGAGEMPVALRSRVELDAVEPRQRGSARPAQRSDALVRRGRRRDVRPRVLPRVQSPASLLGIAPEAALQAGVKPSDLLDLCRAFGEALERLETFARALASVPPMATASVGQAAAQAENPDGLTRREVEVLLLVAEGRTSKEMAAELCVAVPTVSRHLANIYAKIGARNKAEATRYALERLSRELATRRADRLG